MLYDQIKPVLINKLGDQYLESISPSSRLAEDLGADSLDLVEMIVELEGYTGLEISDEDAGRLETVQDIVTYLESHGITSLAVK